MTCRLSCPPSLSLSQTLADTATVVDSVSVGAVGITRSIGESFTLVDGFLGRTVGQSPGVADTASFSDALSYVLSTGVASLQITQAPTDGVDGQAFTPVFIITHPSGAAAAGQTCTATITAGTNGVFVGSATAVFNASGVATFTTMGLDDLLL